MQNLSQSYNLFWALLVFFFSFFQCLAAFGKWESSTDLSPVNSRLLSLINLIRQTLIDMIWVQDSCRDFQYVHLQEWLHTCTLGDLVVLALLFSLCGVWGLDELLLLSVLLALGKTNFEVNGVSVPLPELELATPWGQWEGSEVARSGALQGSECEFWMAVLVVLRGQSQRSSGGRVI